MCTQVFWLWFFNAVYHSLIFFWFPVAMLNHGMYAYFCIGCVEII